MRKLALLSCLVALFSISSFAGEKTLGLSGGFASHNNSGYANVYMQIGVAPHVRLSPDVGYVFRKEGKSAFLVDVNVQFPFRVTKGINLYPLVGAAFNNWSYQHGGHATRFGANFGGGVDINLTRELKFTVEGKYSLMNDTGGGYVGVGIGYNF